MIQEIKPDKRIDQKLRENSIVVFLGGTIENGTAEIWSSYVIEKMKLTQGMEYDVIFMNPRRDEWDSSWVQEQSNPQFNGQVNWELDNIEDSDIIFFNILPDSKSPITLMEIGLCKDKGISVIVCCPDGFYRKGNVDVICSRYGMQQYKDIDSAFGALLTEINRASRNKKTEW
jgi:hypothetical protein